jgi:hypothetical protein
VEVDDLGRHHQDDITVQRTKEPDDPELLIKHMTMKMMKRRWGRNATRRVCITPVPKGFKLPYDQQKYDGSQEPQSWLSDYIQAVKILGGTRETAMQSLQLHLTGAARSWLSTLGEETIGSWEELTKQFTSNFKLTYKRPASIEEQYKKCVDY